MSWQDRVSNTVFSITTGDGKVFTPLWKPGETETDFNHTIYEFIGLEGALVDRKKVKARRFPLVFWFTGDDCIEQAEDFSNSANDNRVWLVTHPYYGNITGQPVSISRNDVDYNASQITVEFLESIVLNVPVSRIALPDLLDARFAAFSVASSETYGSKVQLTASDVSTVTDNAQKTNLTISKVLSGQTYSDYQAKKSAMFSDISNLILAPEDGIKSIQQIIKSPAEFGLSTKITGNLMSDVYKSIKGIL